MVEENFNAGENKEGNKNWLLAVLVVLIIVVLVIIIASYFYGKGTKNPLEGNKDVPQEANKPYVSGLVPTDAKDSEDFLNKVKEKSASVRKNYDANLTEFARKRWESIFKKQNSLEALDWQNSLKFLSQEVQKTADQSTIFKISYKTIRNGVETNNEDYYYLTLSEEKKKELGLSYLRSNAFISEEDILKNLNQKNFARIGKLVPVSNGE